ncbi:MAG: ferritin-like domain-containing protein [Planctomycetota bacterium]
MDIFAYAMQMEKDGERFYREIALKAGSIGIKQIITMLADEEVRHCKALERMQQGRAEPMEDTRVLNDAKNVFVQMKEGGLEFGADSEQIELYEKAQEIEQRSRQFYEEKAGQAERDDQRLLFQQLAAEEAKHYFLLENLIEFVSRPEQWLENAEWFHLEEY